MTISEISPSVTFMDRHKIGYMRFLELCARNCYKSESRVKKYSAQKLLKTILAKKHLSVLEHESCIFSFDLGQQHLFELLEKVPVLASRFSTQGPHCIISGNIRNWLDFVNSSVWQKSHLRASTINLLSEKWPFFFKSKKIKTNPLYGIKLLDDNPTTNLSGLNELEMDRHMTQTYRIVCSRNCSHQLVRYRRNIVFSQESQRYVNYGKKEYSYIIPPKIIEAGLREEFSSLISAAYQNYNKNLSVLRPEDARGILPGCSKTEIIMTATLEEIKHILAQRTDEHAQQEIRNIALDIKKHLEAGYEKNDNQEL